MSEDDILAQDTSSVQLCHGCVPRVHRVLRGTGIWVLCPLCPGEQRVTCAHSYSLSQNYRSYTISPVACYRHAFIHCRTINPYPTNVENRVSS
jgi:hypothetical protein